MHDPSPRARSTSHLARDRVVRMGLVAALAMGLLAAPSTTPPALADCDLLIQTVERPREARGTTFVGTVMWLAEQPGEHSVTFDVDDVYAGDVPRQVAIDSGGCHPLTGFRVGGRYLFSTADITGAGSGNTLAWELSGRRASLMGFDLPAVDYPQRLRGARTLGQALSLVAPDAPARRPTPVPPTKVSPFAVQASVYQACPNTPTGCIRLLDLHGLDDDAHWGTVVLMSTDGRPVQLVTGLPAYLPPGRYAVSASEWLIVPGHTPPAPRAARRLRRIVRIRPRDEGTVLTVEFREDTCAFYISRSPSRFPSPGPSDHTS